jgi:hypothetical protein
MPISAWRVARGRLLTMLITPPVVPCPNSIDDGPRSTSMRSSVNGSVRVLLVYQSNSLRNPSWYSSG